MDLIKLCLVIVIICLYSFELPWDNYVRVYKSIPEGHTCLFALCQVQLCGKGLPHIITEIEVVCKCGIETFLCLVHISDILAWFHWDIIAWRWCLHIHVNWNWYKAIDNCLTLQSILDCVTVTNFEVWERFLQWFHLIYLIFCHIKCALKLREPSQLWVAWLYCSVVVSWLNLDIIKQSARERGASIPSFVSTLANLLGELLVLISS